MGRHLTQILASSQNEISVTSRKIRDNLKNVTFIQGDAHDEEFLYSVLRQDFDCIVVLTDGYLAFPESEPRHTIWVMPESFGRRVEVIL